MVKRYIELIEIVDKRQESKERVGLGDSTHMCVESKIERITNPAAVVIPHRGQTNGSFFNVCASLSSKSPGTQRISEHGKQSSVISICSQVIATHLHVK